MQKSGYETFEENFRQCCLSSQGRLACEVLQDNEEYQELSRECNALYNKIAALLGSKAFYIEAYEVNQNEKGSFLGEMDYRQGFQDCVCLFRRMGLL